MADKITSLNELRDEVHSTALDKGWWAKERSFGDVVALIHSEASEALEEYRNGHRLTEVYAVTGLFGTKQEYPDGVAVWESDERDPRKPEGVPIELADVIIRVLDAAGKYGIDIDQAVQLKMAYNRTRPHRHGGKAL